MARAGRRGAVGTREDAVRLAVIGASGFVGQHVVQLLLARDDVDRLCLMDKVAGPLAGKGRADGRVTVLRAGLEEPDARARLLDEADRFIVLSGILGGGAEADPALARRVNVDATLDLLQELAAAPGRARVVFASTIAVLGNALPDPTGDDAPFNPVMLYGAQKLMMEIALANYSERGQLDGLSLRPSGIMARDGVDAALKTAFMSRLFHAIRRGEDIVLPVGPEHRTWLTSVGTVAANFVHAAVMPTGGMATADRSMTLPALCLSFGALIEALRRRYPDSPSRVSFAPDAEIVRLFGDFPAIETPRADRLGFARDRDADDLVQNSMS